MTEQIRGVILDVDGVLEYHGRALPGAAATIATLRERGIAIRLLTNSTLKSRASCATRLCQKGIQVSAQEVVTASYATAVYLKRLKPASCWIMLEREGLDEFADFQQDLEHPVYIVMGDNRSQFDFEHLNHALRLLLGGSKLIGMIPELVDMSMGDWELNVGSWVGMLARAAGVEATYIGKPGPFAFELALETMRLSKSEVIMVGDKVSSDIKGAQGVGLRSVLLRTGEFREQDLAAAPRPDFVFDSVSDLPGLL
jgi:HAD superfamily hydrolase (TIGR01458 family)